MLSRAGRLILVLWVALACRASPSRADHIVVPAAALDSGGPAVFLYRFDAPTSGHGSLHVEWTDSLGRLVERRDVPFALRQGTDAPFTLDLERGVAMANRARVEARFAGHANPVATTTASFILPSRAPAWSDYQIIMWQPRTPAQYRALAQIGLSAGEVHAIRADPSDLSWDEMRPLLASNLPWYVENIATDFYAAYHRWFPNRPVNWRFTEIQAQYQKDPDDPRLLRRDPSLSDPRWLAAIRERIAATVAAFHPYRPLFYNLADESGIADLAAFWDFDVSPPSLAGMRAWLEKSYGSLAALNAEWGTHFAGWSAVVPMTTRDAIATQTDNLAAWADFKEWMDVAFAAAIRAGTDAVHAADPSALSAIEGAQTPGWGGYDYARLAHAVDLIALYHLGENAEIALSLNPRLVYLTTSFNRGAAEEHRVWRELLHGSRGLVLWDEDDDFAGKDGTLGKRGREVAPYFRAIRDGLGALFINSDRVPGPVAILYSPPSMRVQWMLDWRGKGDAWSRRDSEAEGSRDNTVRRAVEAYTTLVEQAGLQPRFLSGTELASGALEREGCRVLILPHAIALSAADAAAVRRFAAQGGTVIADVPPAQFDEHGRKQSKPALADLFGRGRVVYLPPEPPAEELGRLRSLFAAARVRPPLAVSRPDGSPADDTELSVFRNGGVEIVAL